MAREVHGMAAILDADVVDRSRVMEQDQSGWTARHGGRLVALPGDGARAEFPTAAAALGAAIEFQQAVADANRGQPADAAVVFRLRLHLDGAREDHTPEQDRAPERPGGIVAAAARPLTARGEATPLGRRAGAIAGAAILLAAAWLAFWMPRSPSASAGWRAPPAGVLDPELLQRRAETALAHWQQEPGEPDESDDQPANPANAPPVDTYDGLYAGTATTRADGRVVTFRLKVTNGVGVGTQSQRECGTAPIALRVSPFGAVNGMALMFGATCLKTELAIRGRALGGTLQLRLGSDHLELSKPGD